MNISTARNKEPKKIDIPQAVILEISRHLSDSAKQDIIRGSAPTETILGHFRGWRDELLNMKLDFTDLLNNSNLKRSQKKQAFDQLQAEFKRHLITTKQFEKVLTDQLGMLNNLSETKQEALHQIDEQIYDEQELMKLIHEEVIRKGKRMINVNRLLQQLNS